MLDVIIFIPLYINSFFKRTKFIVVVKGRYSKKKLFGEERDVQT